MGPKEVSYAEDRLEFFKEQLAHAERVLDWWAKNIPDPDVCANNKQVVSFYRDIVKMLEEGHL